jgi:hypothetical protein
MRDVQLNCVDRHGTLISPLPDAVLDHVTWELNAPGEIVYDMNQNSRQILVPQECKNELQLLIDGKVRHWGLHYKTREAPRSCTFTCPGLMQYFAHRFVTNTSLEFAYNPTGSTDIATWLPVEQLDIGAGVINAKNYNLNIDVADYDPSGVQRLRIYDIFSHQNVLNTILAEFPKLADANGNPTGFDFDIDVSQAPQRLFTMYYPMKGMYQDIPFQWGRNISNYGNDVDGSSLCNTAYFTGASNGDIKFENHFTDPATEYVPFEDVRAQGSESDVNTLLELSQRWVTEHAQPIQTPDLDTIEVGDDLLDVLSTGDFIHVTIKNGRTDIDDWVRIQKITWKPADQVLKLALFSSAGTELTLA